MSLAYVEFSSPINDWFEVNSYSFNPGSMGGTMAGGGTGKAQFHDFQFTKKTDSLTEALFRHCASGKTFATVWLELYRDADSDVYMTYTMSNVMISAVSINGSDESVSLNYKTAKAAYFGR